jgi:hypothetical protein
MVLTYTIVSNTDEEGRFLMAVPIRMTEEDFAVVDVGAVHNTTNVRNRLDRYWQRAGKRTRDDDEGKPTMRSLGSSSVISLQSGPFQLNFVKDTEDIDQVETVIRECGVEDPLVQLYIDQMKDLNRQVLFVQYLPARDSTVDEDRVYQIAKSIYDESPSDLLSN